jgi:hypothetical protein
MSSTLGDCFAAAVDLVPTLSPPESMLPSVYGYYKLSSPVLDKTFDSVYGKGRSANTPSFWNVRDRAKFMGICACYDAILADAVADGVVTASLNDDIISEYAMKGYIEIADSLYKNEDGGDSNSLSEVSLTAAHLPETRLLALQAMPVIAAKLSSGKTAGVMDNAVSVPVPNAEEEIRMIEAMNKANLGAAEASTLPPPPPSSDDDHLITAATLHTVPTLTVDALVASLPAPDALAALIDPLQKSNVLHFLVSSSASLPLLSAVMQHVKDPALLKTLTNAGDSNGTTPFLAALSLDDAGMVMLMSAFADVAAKDDDGEGWRDYAEKGGASWSMCETMELENAELNK